MKLLADEHDVEADNLDHKLKLEQQEGIESLRKRYAVLRRLEVKKAQHTALDIAKSNLGEEQCDWLMKEHFKNQSMVEKMFDDEAVSYVLFIYHMHYIYIYLYIHSMNNILSIIKM